jgi:hypothetical protein
MKIDIVLAVGSATVQGRSLLGANVYTQPGESLLLDRQERRIHSPDETLTLGDIVVPQMRQSHRVVGCRRGQDWGYLFGCNEHHVALGVSQWRSKLWRPSGGISGPDLVRLTLQRAHSARHAIDLLGEFLEKYGQRGDHVFLACDGREGFVLEAAGNFWATIECHQMRAVSDCALIRQDWQRLSRGLADHVHARGWWPDDGSKLDFVACLGDPTHACSVDLKRWGRATLALASQEGAIDPYVLRRILAEHCEHFQQLRPSTYSLAGSLVAELSPDTQHPVLLWHADHLTGPGVYFAHTLDSDRVVAREATGSLLRELQEHLQSQLDLEAEKFLSQIMLASPIGGRQALCEDFAQRQIERWQRLSLGRKEPAISRPRRPRMEEMMSFISE